MREEAESPQGWVCQSKWTHFGKVSKPRLRRGGRIGEVALPHSKRKNKAKELQTCKRVGYKLAEMLFFLFVPLLSLFSLEISLISASTLVVPHFTHPASLPRLTPFSRKNSNSSLALIYLPTTSHASLGLVARFYTTRPYPRTYLTHTKLCFLLTSAIRPSLPPSLPHPSTHTHVS